MRSLVLLRGCQGAGKSTWVKNNQLDKYTLSADDIRLLFQSPVMSAEGGFTISPSHDGRVWDLLLSLLEERMVRGEFTIIDATHAKQASITNYKKLAQRYRYRVFVVDFSDISLAQALENNKNRESYKQVPELAVINTFERIHTEHVPRWTTSIKPHEFHDHLTYLKKDLSEYKRVHVIGDVHGCNTVLQEYLNNEPLKEDEAYIFCGDYIDRGIENVEVIKFLLEIKDNPNVILLEGNHDTHLVKYAYDDDLKGNSKFKKYTVPEIEASDLTKSDLRQLTRRFAQVAYFTYFDQDFIVTHGGIADVPDNLMYMASEQFIKGVGDYSDDIDHIYHSNQAKTGKPRNERPIQIHGHRNLFRLPLDTGLHSYNLEGGVEQGKFLRAVQIESTGLGTVNILPVEVKNTVFHEREVQNHIKEAKIDDLSVEEVLIRLRDNSFIREKKMPDNISSFNFTRRAFDKRKWFEETIKARGLFINTNTNEIVARGYEKFFNVGERFDTRMHHLVDSLQFPVTVYKKENGFLGLVGYNSETNELVYTSKSYTSKGVESGEAHVNMFKALFIETYKDNLFVIKEKLKKDNICLIFEVVLPEEDPHIISYDKKRLVLLDIVKRDVKFETFPYTSLITFCILYGGEIKQEKQEFHDWASFYRWYLEVKDDMTDTQTEGYVVEDSNRYMFKIKMPYYSMWKGLRRIKDEIGKNRDHLVKHGGLLTPEANRFVHWAKQQDKKYLLETDIITLRNEFYKEYKGGNTHEKDNNQR